MIQTWDTDTEKLAMAVAEFECVLPGWWWAVGMCSVGAHASCGADSKGAAAHLLDGIEAGHPYDFGFHADTDGGKPHEAIAEVMYDALAFIADQKKAEGKTK